MIVLLALVNIEHWDFIQANSKLNLKSWGLNFTKSTKTHWMIYVSPEKVLIFQPGEWSLHAGCHIWMKTSCSFVLYILSLFMSFQKCQYFSHVRAVASNCSYFFAQRKNEKHKNLLFLFLEHLACRSALVSTIYAAVKEVQNNICVTFSHTLQ